MSYAYRSLTGAQMGCDFVRCPNIAVGYAEVGLKDQSLGGLRDTLHLALCAEHIGIGVPVERVWVGEAS